MNNWNFISVIGGIIGFVLSLLFVDNWKIAVVIAIIVFVIIIFYNPKRRYLKAFYFILSLLITLNKFFFQLIGHISGVDIQIGSDKINTATNITFIGLAGLSLYLDYKERNKRVKPDKNGSPRFTEDGHITDPQYILNPSELGIDSLVKTKRDLEILIENFKLKIIEHQSEVRKIKIILERYEGELDFVNTEIKSLRNQNTNE